MGSKGSTTQNTTQTYNPAGSSYLTGALQTAQNAAQTPFQNYTGQLVAPVNQQQNLGISGVNQYANAAQPYIGDAANYINAGAASPAGNISQFLNPYTQQVVDATQNQFNQSNKVQQSQLLGNAASMGALGGDRSAIAQSELAKQQNLAQNPVIAGLYSQGFNTALGAAQNYGQQQLSAGYGLGSLGTAAQTAGLQGATQQIGAGSLQQQTSQAQNQAQYNEFLRQAGYPFQASQFLTQATSSLAPSLGGTQQGYSQTTPAQPSLLGQIAGLGLAGAGIYNGFGGNKGSTGGGTQTGSLPSAPQFGNYGGIQYPIFNRGGAVYADGGDVPMTPAEAVQTAQQAEADYKSRISRGDVLRGLVALDREGRRRATPQYASGGPVAGLSLLDHVLPMVDAIRAHRERGGQVLNTRQDANGVFIPQGFADGGSPDFNAAFQPFSVPPDNTDPNRALAEGMINKFLPEGAIELNAGAPIPRPRPPEADAPAGFALPPQFTQDEPPLPGDAMAFSGGPGNGPSAAPQAPSGIAPEGNQWAPIIQSAIRDLQQKRQPSASASPWNALTAAGLGILASGSPFPGVAIGKGGLEGLGSLERQQAAERQNAAQQAQQSAQVGNLAIHGLTAEQAAQRLLQDAQRHAATLAETTRHNQTVEGLTREQRQTTQMQPVTIGFTPKGIEIKGVRDPNTQSFRVIDPATGKLLEPGEGIPNAKPAGSTYIDPQTGKPIASADGIIPSNAQLVSSGTPYDYSSDAPPIEKGMDVPKPAPVAGKSTGAIQTDGELFVQTGKLPPAAKGKNPAAIQMNDYRNAVQNYGVSLAASRGLTPEQTAEMWRTAPGMLRFILGADGRSTVALGTAARHVDTFQQLAKAWQANDVQAINRLRSTISREFGSEAATNLDAAGRIIGPEIVKALGVAGAGTEHDRNTISQMFSSIVSPAQGLGAAQTVQALLGGQLDGKRRQALNSGLTEERFKNLIGDRPYEILSHAEKGTPAGTPAGAPAGAPANPQDKAALDWATANPNDPRAAAIKKRLGLP